VEHGTTKTPMGKATAENPFYKFYSKLIKLVEALPMESEVVPSGTQLAKPFFIFLKTDKVNSVNLILIKRDNHEIDSIKIK